MAIISFSFCFAWILFTVLCWLVWLSRGLPPGGSAAVAAEVTSSSTIAVKIHPKQVHASPPQQHQQALTADVNRNVPPYFVSSYHTEGGASPRNGVHSSAVHSPQAMDTVQLEPQRYPYRTVVSADNYGGDARGSATRPLGGQALFEHGESRDGEGLLDGRSDAGPDQAIASDGGDNEHLRKKSSFAKEIESETEDGEIKYGVYRSSNDLHAAHDSPINYLPIQQSRLANCSNFLQVRIGSRFS